MSPMRFIGIEFTDGSKIRYSFPVQTGSKAAQQVKVEDFLKGRHLLVHAEGRLVVYPIENVRSIEFSAETAVMEGIKLPPHTIREATLLAR